MDPITKAPLTSIYIVSYFGALGLLVMAAAGDPTSRAIVAWMTRKL